MAWRGVAWSTSFGGTRPLSAKSPAVATCHVSEKKKRSTLRSADTFDPALVGHDVGRTNHRLAPRRAAPLVRVRADICCSSARRMTSLPCLVKSLHRLKRASVVVPAAAAAAVVVEVTAAAAAGGSLLLSEENLPRFWFARSATSSVVGRRRRPRPR